MVTAAVERAALNDTPQARAHMPRIALHATPLQEKCAGFATCGPLILTQEQESGNLIRCLGEGVSKEIHQAVERLQCFTGADFINLAQASGRTHVAWGENYDRSRAWYPHESQLLKGVYSTNDLNKVNKALQGTFGSSIVECAAPEASEFRTFKSTLHIPLKVCASPVDDVMLLQRTVHQGGLVVWRDEQGVLRHKEVASTASLDGLPPRVVAAVEYLSGRRERIRVGDTAVSLSLRDGWLQVVNDKTGITALSVRTSQATLAYDAAGKPSHLLCVDAALGTLYEVRLTEASGRGLDVTARDLKLGEGQSVRGMVASRDGGLLMLCIQEGDTSRLEVVDRASLRGLATYQGGGDNLRLDEGGKILFIDSNGGLISGSTNFAALALGGYERAEVVKAESLERATAFVAGLPAIDLAARGESSLLGVDPIRGSIVDRYRSTLPEVDTVEEVEALKRDLETLRAAPALAAFTEAFDPAEKLLQERESDVLSAAFDEACDTVTTQLRAKRPDAAAILEGVDALRTLRSRWKIPEADRREAASQRLAQIEGDVNSFLQSNSERNVLQAKSALAAIEKSLSTCSSSAEVTSCFDSPEVGKFLTLVRAIVDADSRDALNHTFEKLFQDTADRLRQPSEAATVSTRARLTELRRKVMDRLAKADSREEVEQAASVDMQILDTLAEQLPETMRREILRPVQNALSVKARAIGAREKVISRGSTGEVTFNGVPFPVYGDFSLIVTPQIREGRDGSGGQLVWLDGVGREYHPATGAACLPLDPEDPAAKEAIAASRDEAVAFFKATPRRVPQPRAHWRTPKHTEEQLGALAKAFSGQLRRQSGITMLIGEAGTGKNVMVDLFAAHTNREVFQFSCNRQTDKEDISYAYLYDPERGTYKVDSQLLKAVQTPGAILVLDEINTLPPGVLKMFNAPLDERRSFFLPDGRVIKIDPSVIIVGCMNPPWYLGTEQLPQEIKSRARFIPIEYPPVGEPGMWRSDEAEMIAAFSDTLKDIQPELFRAMWNATINKQPIKGLESHITPQIEAELKALHKVVRIAAKAREAYRAYRDGSSADGFELAVSLRETSDICAELTPGADVIDVVNSVLLNKVHDPAQQRYLRELIAHAI